MKMRSSIVCAATGLLFSMSATAWAQAWPERVHVSVNGAFQSASNDFSDRFEFERNVETGSTAADYRVGGGLLFDGGGGVRLWKQLGAGVSVSIFNRTDAAATTTRSPHPFFFERLREA